MRAGEILAERLGRWTGLDLQRGGREDALERLLGERVRMVGAKSVDAYVAALDRPDDPEASWLVNALTVGHTWFFRDGEQLAAVAQLLKEERRRPVRIWVAACATGDEAYTIAMLAHFHAITAEILATDINSKALERACAAEYSQWAVREVPRELSGMLESASSGRVRMSAVIRQAVRFQRHNLVDPPPVPRTGVGWHVILCRNVLIYFRRADVPPTARRLASALTTGGYLIFGAGEILDPALPGFSLAQIGNLPGARYALRRSDAGTVPRPVTPTRAATSTPTAVAVEPRDDLLERALERIDSGQAGEAIALCALALERDPLSPQAHLVSGIAFYIGEDPRSAAHVLRGALLLDPDEWIASFYLALSYEKLGREDEARRAYAQVPRASEEREPRRSRLPLLEAYRDEISLLAHARSRGLFRR
jgi:chemotaxis methyl-accepting protein methylase